ncbi:zinc ribbon domain-containing protein [Enterocloster bolteae]|uniref:zinc ribbon domain-containing protein n=1 Tax=Enterocloster bolteae TaxID=208479 RepID=UPI0002D15678|nr:zinc ribbon domain-containing protein [Enterocloster bolteae]ENZ39254.1 hypothetical protein HMPREF1089_03884 [Enterocloster bolteae 90B3]RGB90891.1 hypothetical protein DWZ21_29945 [Hungatella hathewayi]
MIEEGIVKDLSMVVENAKLMGCQEVKSFKNIPLKNVETVISALQRQVPREVRNIYPVEVKETGLHILTGDCPRCSAPIPAEQRYCWKCGQRLDWTED